MAWWGISILLAFFVPVVGIPMLVLVALVTWALKSAQHQVTGNPGTPPAETEPSARMARSAMQPSSAANRTAYDLFMAHTAGNTVLAHTHFPLTIEGAGRDVVARIDSLLSAPGKINPRECRAEIAMLFSRHNFTCKEVEDFLASIRKEYEKKVADALSNVDMSKLNDKERASAIAEAENDAIDSLKASLCLKWEDIGVLMRDRPADMKVDDNSAGIVGGNAQLLSKYMWLLDGGRVIQVQDSGLRAQLATLEDLGLVRSGRAIPLDRLADRVSLAGLRESVADIAPKKFTRKADVIEFLMQQPDAKERMENLLPWRDLYEAIPPAGVDVSAAVQAYRYADQYASLIVTTAITTRRAMEAVKEANEDSGKVRVTASSDCKICRAHDDKLVTSRSPQRLPPHHVGCTCYSDAEFV